jgi:hypothetical protein
MNSYSAVASGDGVLYGDVEEDDGEFQRVGIRWSQGEVITVRVLDSKARVGDRAVLQYRDGRWFAKPESDC